MTRLYLEAGVSIAKARVPILNKVLIIDFWRGYERSVFNYFKWISKYLGGNIIFNIILNNIIIIQSLYSSILIILIRLSIGNINIYSNIDL